MRHSALGISIALHLAALALVSLTPDNRAKSPPSPIAITLLRPAQRPLPLPKKAPPRPPPAVIPKTAPPKTTEPQTPLQPRAENKPPQANANGGGLILPSFLPTTTNTKIETRIAPPVTRGSNEPRTSGSDAMAKLRTQWARETNLRNIDGRTSQIGRSLLNAFNANKTQMNDATPHPVLVIIEQWQREMPANLGTGTEAADQTTLTNRRRGEGDGESNTLDPMQYNFCFGACSNASHEVTRVETLIHIEHDELGVPQRWSIGRSSDRAPFDVKALEAVQLALGCMKDGTHHVLFCRPLEPTHGSVPRHSEWMLSGIVYRWSNFERLLDPQFKPSGTKIAQGPFAGHYLDSSVRLVDLEYWEAASSLPKAN